jgi:hypothetical protein
MLLAKPTSAAVLGAVLIATSGCAPTTTADLHLGAGIDQLQAVHSAKGYVEFEYLTKQDADEFSGVIIPIYCVFDDRADDEGLFRLLQQCLVKDGLITNCEQFDVPKTKTLTHVYGHRIGKGLQLKVVGANAFTKLRTQRISFESDKLTSQEASRLPPSVKSTFEGRIVFSEKYQTYWYELLKGKVVRTSVHEYHAAKWP